MPSIDLEFVRANFPSLHDDSVLLDNAGGSQVLERVADRVRDYLLTETVQLGASYDASRKSGDAVDRGRAAIAQLVNAAQPQEVVMGGTATQLFEQLARALSKKWQPGDEVIVTDFDHEANIGPWRNLAAQGIVIREWRMPKGNDIPDLDDLRALFSDNTKLVAFTHVSNIFGSIMPVREITDIIHAHGALACVDGVAFAPHRAVDVRALGADFYGFSLYKAYGPHHAALYGQYDILRDQAANINHYFYGEDRVPNKLEPGNPNYELAHSCIGIVEYLEEFAVKHGVNVSGRPAIEAAFDIMADHETDLSERLLSFLRSRNDIEIIGTESADRAKRVPTISFIHKGHSSEQLVRKIDQSGIGIRFGDFASKRLVNGMDTGTPDGVIRVSAVHYNTLEEMDRLIAALDAALEETA